MQIKKNKPKFDMSGLTDEKNGGKKSVKAKDYFYNRKGVSVQKSRKNESFGGKKTRSGEKNEINKRISDNRYLLVCDDYDENFKGKTKLGAIDFVVDGAIVGEKFEAEVKRKRGTCFYADFVKSDCPSEFRREIACDNFLNCGNCALLHLSYKKQTEMKRESVMDAVKPYFYDVGETVSTGEFAYRNKAHLAFAEIDRKLVMGFFDDLSHEIIPVRKCLLHGDWFDFCVKTITQWARSGSFHAYNPRTGKGLLRYALLRKTDDGIMLTLVVNGGKLSGTDKLYGLLKERFAKVCFYVCENRTSSSAVLSGKLRLVAGEERLTGEMSGIKFTLSPDSFFQINEKTAERIYSDVLKIIENSSATTVVDCFSGIGITSALFAKSGKKVVSIEIVPSAVRDAKQIAALNGLSGKITHLCGDAAKLLPTIGGADESIFFVDPPRNGLGAKATLAVVSYLPKQIVYLSCNPSSLKEDLKTFIDNGYKIESVTPYDLFPNTKHIETLVSLKLKGK